MKSVPKRQTARMAGTNNRDNIPRPADARMTFVYGWTEIVAPH